LMVPALIGWPLNFTVPETGLRFGPDEHPAAKPKTTNRIGKVRRKQLMAVSDGTVAGNPLTASPPWHRLAGRRYWRDGA
jgi:hypothetical protein